MRVALDCRSVFPGMGGIGRATAALARHLPVALASEDELVLLLGDRQPDPDQVRPASPGSVRVQCVPTHAGMIDPIFEQLRLPALLRELRADLVHTTCFTTPIAAEAVARVATVHDVVFRRHPELVDEELRAYLDHWAGLSCRLADAVTTPSRFSREEIAAVYGRPQDEIQVVPNGVDQRFFAVERRPASTPPFVLYVGSLEQKKSVPDLLLGFARLLELAPGLPHHLFLVGGSGGQRFDLGRALGPLGPARDRVHVLGWVPEEQLLSLYAQATCFVYLSRYEGFGLPPLEAMAAGIPTLVSDRASLPEVVGDGARRVDPDDRDALAHALRELLLDPREREGLVARGRARARAFPWSTAAEELVRVYRRAVERATPRRGRAEPAPGPRLKLLTGGGS